jgi:hypothetical protein
MCCVVPSPTHQMCYYTNLMSVKWRTFSCTCQTQEGGEDLK